MDNRNSCNNRTDFGPEPFVTDIRAATLSNCTFRTALWTGKCLQLTLMCIPVGGEIGLESLNKAISERFRGELGKKNLQAIKTAYERVS